MSAIHLTLALGPLAIYGLLLGRMNLLRRPTLTTGTRDIYALGVALSGLMIIGPMELFMPITAAERLGPLVWLLLLTFYSMCLTLSVMLVRHRLVIYNLTSEQIRPLLSTVIERLELEHHWAGDSLSIPGLGLQLQVEQFPVMRNVSLVATATEQNYRGWQILEQEISKELAKLEVPSNPFGLALIGVCVVTLAIVSVRLYSEDPNEVVADAFDILRLEPMVEPPPAGGEDAP